MATTITNKHGVSDAIVNACKIDNHVTMGDISVTQLLDAPQVRILKKSCDMEEDVTDRIWALMGTAVHYVLQLGEVGIREAKILLEASEILMAEDEDKASKWITKFVKEKYPQAINPDVITEKTLSFTMHDMTFSGTFDRYTISRKLLEDYKNTSTYPYTNPEARKKWIGQLNVYAFLLRENGYEVDEAHITAIFRDFSAAKSFAPGYPKKPIETFSIDLYDQEFMRDYIGKRILLHKEAEAGNIPPCTAKDMWATKDSFAVTTKTRKKAIKLFPKKAMAEAFLLGDGAKYAGAIIQTRRGEARRCASYCPVSHVCPQNKERLRLIAEEAENK
jgi:hypothetical protein